MIVNLDEIKELILNGNLSEVARETGLKYRTLQSYKLEENKWLADTIDKLERLQTYINEEENKMTNKGVLVIDVAVRYHDFIKAGIFEKGFEVLEDSYLELVISKEQYVKLLGKHIHLAYVHEDLDTVQDDDIRIYVKRGKGTRADVFEINRIA